VIRPSLEPRLEKTKAKIACAAADCGKEFEFARGETRVFELPLPIFERGHFYRSELREAGG
jgi:hypothetical protein